MVGIISEWWIRLAIGLLGSGMIGMLAFKLKALSMSGVISAMIIGTTFILIGEPVWFILLIVFFISSTFWSKFKRKVRAKQLAEAVYEKTGQRDAGQVWANGGVGFILIICSFIFPSHLWLLAYIGVMSSVNADTWATEIGTLSKATPRSILTGKKVVAGTSGGITLLGTTASFAGAAAIGLSAALVTGWSPYYIFIGGLSGFAGAWIDSALGAKWQTMYRCNVCKLETERSEHCGQQTILIRGIKWLNNDAVNLTSSIVAGIIAILFGMLLLK